jgi:lipid-binding SYLF domain-containing protein
MSVGRFARISCIGLLALLALGCLGPRGETKADKRTHVRTMRDETLAEVGKFRPQLAAELRQAAGYAVFSNLTVKVFVVGPGQGYGMLVDNRTGNETFMRMAQIGAGVGMGAKTYRVLFVFHDPQTLASFRENGWQFGGEAEAAAKAGNAGIAAGAQGSVVDGGAAVGTAGAVGSSGAGGGSGAAMDVYQLTDTGIALTAGVAGTKYWRDKRL